MIGDIFLIIIANEKIKFTKVAFIMSIIRIVVSWLRHQKFNN